MQVAWLGNIHNSCWRHLTEMKLSITSTLLLALLLVVNVAHGCNDDGGVGEYWGKKAIETLSGIKSNEERQNSGEYWGKKAIEALVGLKSNDVHKFNSIVKDFKFKPNQWQYLDTNPKLENGETTTYFVKDFVPKPNHVLQWHHGAASHDDDEVAPIYFVKDFVPKPNHVLQWHHGAASHDDEVSTAKYFVRDFEPKINHVLQWHHGAANPTKDVWPTIKSVVTGFKFN
ncbi:uncharacterized protein LOC110681997 [Chenopodium quinoa]|uniref:uncharacterized protein LOC110681997 n=1 Tax=Chenopodium quinoa TaxID=63459 RepID=UPI000B790F80|nr:uncharacterized protein LOC110681997 [Chenopodium quinoa]